MAVMFAHPKVYWLLVLVALAALLTATCLPLIRAGNPRSRLFARDGVFLAIAALAFVAMRWPTLFGADAYIDEAQMIAQAITAAHHPIPWRSFDGTTSGPLNTYAILLPAVVGVGPSLFAARITAAVFALTAVGAFFVAVRPLRGTWLARLATLPPLLLFGMGGNVDFAAYSSEIVPIALLAAALACATRIASTKRSPLATVVAAGLLCGAVPFAKLQGSVLAVLTAGATIAAIAYAEPDRRSLVRRVATLIVAAIVPATVILGAVAISGAFHDFLISYLAQNINSLNGPVATLQTAYVFDEYHAYFTRSAVVAAAAFALWLFVVVRVRAEDRGPERFHATLVAVAAVFVLASIYTVEAPHRPYQHYFLFVIFPITFAVAALIAAADASAMTGNRFVRAIAVGLAAVYALAFAQPIFSAARSGRTAYLNSVPGGIANAPDPVAERIAAVDPPGGRVAIWGYAPYLYVKSATMMGTRDSLAQFSLTPGPYQEYYRRRFLADLRANRPELFVDACAPRQFNFTERSLYGYETFPEMAAYVDAHYHLAAQVEGVRIYRRRDHA